MYVERFGENFPSRSGRKSEDPAENIREARLHFAKYEEEDRFLNSRGIPRWLARIVFREHVQVIWASKDMMTLRHAT